MSDYLYPNSRISRELGIRGTHGPMNIEERMQSPSATQLIPGTRRIEMNRLIDGSMAVNPLGPAELRRCARTRIYILACYTKPWTQERLDDVRMNHPSKEWRLEAQLAMSQEELIRYRRDFIGTPVMIEHRGSAIEDPSLLYSMSSGVVVHVMQANDGSTLVGARFFDDDDGLHAVSMMEHGLFFGASLQFRRIPIAGGESIVSIREISLCVLGRRPGTGLVGICEYLAAPPPLRAKSKTYVHPHIETVLDLLPQNRLTFQQLSLFAPHVNRQLMSINSSGDAAPIRAAKEAAFSLAMDDTKSNEPSVWTILVTGKVGNRSQIGQISSSTAFAAASIETKTRGEKSENFDRLKKTLSESATTSSASASSSSSSFLCPVEINRPSSSVVSIPIIPVLTRSSVIPARSLFSAAAPSTRLHLAMSGVSVNTASLPTAAAAAGLAPMPATQAPTLPTAAAPMTSAPVPALSPISTPSLPVAAIADAAAATTPPTTGSGSTPPLAVGTGLPAPADPLTANATNPAALLADLGLTSSSGSAALPSPPLASNSLTNALAQFKNMTPAEQAQFVGGLVAELAPGESMDVGATTEDGDLAKSNADASATTAAAAADESAPMAIDDAASPVGTTGAAAADDFDEEQKEERVKVPAAAMLPTATAPVLPTATLTPLSELMARHDQAKASESTRDATPLSDDMQGLLQTIKQLQAEKRSAEEFAQQVSVNAAQELKKVDVYRADSNKLYRQMAGEMVQTFGLLANKDMANNLMQINEHPDVADMTLRTLFSVDQFPHLVSVCHTRAKNLAGGESEKPAASHTLVQGEAKADFTNSKNKTIEGLMSGSAPTGLKTVPSSSPLAGALIKAPATKVVAPGYASSKNPELARNLSVLQKAYNTHFTPSLVSMPLHANQRHATLPPGGGAATVDAKLESVNSGALAGSKRPAPAHAASQPSAGESFLRRVLNPPSRESAQQQQARPSMSSAESDSIRMTDAALKRARLGL